MGPSPEVEHALLGRRADKEQNRLSDMPSSSSSASDAPASVPYFPAPGLTNPLPSFSQTPSPSESGRREQRRGRGGRRGYASVWLPVLLELGLPVLWLLLALRRLLPALLLAAAVALAAWAAWSSRRRNYWRRRGVPAPTPTPIVGNLWPLLRLRISPAAFVGRLYRFAPDSPVVGFFILDKPCLLVRDPALVKRILVTDFACFSARHASSNVTVDPAGASNLFAARGSCWAFTRRSLSPSFTSGKLRAMFHVMEARTAALADHVQNTSATPGRPLKIKDAVGRALTDLVAETMFGLESNALKRGGGAEVRKHGRRIFGFSLRRAFEILAIFFVPALLRPGRVQFFHEGSSDFFERLFKEIMEFRRKEGRVRGDAMDEMLAMQKKAAELLTSADGSREQLPAIVATDEHVVGQAQVFFTAGFETSATAVSTALFELARNAPVQQRLRDELRATVRLHGGLSYEALTQVAYLHWVILEALRLYPSLPYLDRTCAHEYQLLPDAASGAGRGLMLEAGTPVFIPIMALQRDERLFPEPEAFRPERWAVDAQPQPPLFLSFGGGPRTCIGMRFALLTVKLTLAQLLLRFEVTPCADTPQRLTVSPFGLFLKFVGGIPLQFTALQEDDNQHT